LCPSQREASHSAAGISPACLYTSVQNGIRMVPERARIFPRLTVYENLLTGVYGLRKKVDVDERVAWLYEIFPILKERRGPVGEDPVRRGAAAACHCPRPCFAPELPFGGPKSPWGSCRKLVDEVFAILKQLNEEQGLSILLVEQNAVASLAISTRGYVLETGTLRLQWSRGRIDGESQGEGGLFGLLNRAVLSF